jgi:hypothetical protein
MARAFTAAAIAYSTLVIVLTWPLALHLSSVVPHDLGDPLLTTAILWWNAHVTPLTTPWWNGFAFFPADGTLALSDHRLGESLLATPLQWLGMSAVAAYNVTLLATFPLCALAAHWLAFTLTRRHDASLVSGLGYGFCPYRIAHLQHLELLAAVGMPLALAALHRYRQTAASHWLVWFTLALVLQGLCTSYYLLFFSLLLTLWIVWFVGWRDARALASVAMAAAAAAVVLLPVITGYARIHARYGLQRDIHDIQRLSADVTGFAVASPLSALWGWTSGWARPEGELFPGLTIAVLVIAGGAIAWNNARVTPTGRGGRRAYILAAGGVCAAIALAGWFSPAPWHLQLVGVRVSSEAPFKPFSLAVVAFICWLAGSPRLHAASVRGAPLAFYAGATAILVICSLGPEPAMNGHQILYKPIYAWLMELPPFDAIRAPARFGMLMMLTLSVTGALVIGHLRLSPHRRRILVGLVACGIVADVWIRDLPLVALPNSWPASRAAGFTAVLELPLGDVFDDAAAMYRAIDHAHPVANGSSGFEAAHYMTLRTALAEHDPAALDGFPAGVRLLIVVDKQKDARRTWRTYLETLPRVRPQAEDDRWAFFAAEPPSPSATCEGRPLPIAGMAAEPPAGDLRVLTDRDPATWWTTSHAQREGDALVLDLGRAVQPCAVAIAIGQFRASYPRQLVVETSLTRDAWTAVADRRTAGLAMTGALQDPATVSIVVPLSPSTGRFLRLRVAQSHPTIPWMITDVTVTTAAPGKE